MIQFTRHLISCGLVIESEHVTESETLSIHCGHQDFVLGAEPYSLVICPHGVQDNPWRIEGLRGDDEVEIWYTGTMAACITEFERITAEIRAQGHQITEPENYDFESAIREYHKEILAIPRWNHMEDTLNAKLIPIDRENLVNGAKQAVEEGVSFDEYAELVAKVLVSGQSIDEVKTILIDTGIGAYFEEE